MPEATAAQRSGLRAWPVWLVVLLCIVPAGFYYAMLISVGCPSFFAPVHHGLTFNSMLLHLLNGQYDVDPQTIGLEGSVRNGLTYTYFGIVLALVRAPFVAVRDFAGLDLTRLSCLSAVVAMASFKLASVFTAWRAVGRPERWPLLLVVAGAILLSGSQIQFLWASIWQEAVFWGAALASAFLYLVVYAYFSPRGFTPGILAGLAALAALCLHTRVSTALGLYVALGLLMLQLLWQSWRDGGFRGLIPTLLPRFLPAILILGASVALVGWVNYQRWGHPLVFSDPNLYLLSLVQEPERLVRAAQYGQFNILRLGYGLVYYFFPVWVMRDADGGLLWSAFQQRMIDSVELPPASFFLSDPLLLGLMAFGLVALIGKRAAIDRAIAVPVLAGLFVPVMLILTFNSMTFRYRLEFYPFFDLCAVLGFALLAARPKPPPIRTCAVAATVGILASHGFWVLYVLSRFGNANEMLHGMDVISFYRSFFH